MEPLIIGSLVGFLIAAGPFDFFEKWIEAVYAVMGDPSTIWIILLCGLLGSFVALLEKSGGLLGFSKITDRWSKNRETALFYTWLLGLLIFIDNYINVMAAGSAMRCTTDKFRISREFLAFVLNSAGAAICVLVPFSTWGAFMFGQLKTIGVWEQGSSIVSYLQVVPYILYAWVAIFMVPLYSYRLLPCFGPMKKAEQRAEKTGQTLPDSMLQLAGDKILGEEALSTARHTKAGNFIIPMLILCTVSVYSKDMLTGVIIGILSCLVFYYPQRIADFPEFCDAMMEGFKEMTPVLGILVAAFLLQQSNDALGLTTYVIESILPYLNAYMLPAITFVVISLLAFGTGSFWGIAAIAFPIIIPLSQALDAHTLLTCGAIISGTVMGSHSCFYSDAVTLTCTSSQIQNSDYARCALPLISVPFVLCILLYLILGFTL